MQLKNVEIFYFFGAPKKDGEKDYLSEMNN